MRFVLKGANVFFENSFKVLDVCIADGKIIDISPCIAVYNDDIVFNFNNYHILPGLIDVHVHLREPGFSYKETISTGTKAAARGGYTTVCSMPNLSPVPDCMENLKVQRDIIKRDAVIRVVPYGAITVGEMGEQLSNMEEMAKYVAAFSDDGRGIQSEDMMLSAMQKAKQCGKIIAAHCEDNSLLNGGCIHDGQFAKEHGYKGISSESEWKQIERDLKLAEKTGCAYHVCHISTKESVALIRKAKQGGVDVTCETAPHYLTLCDMDIQEEGRFKMNPPLRSSEDKAALIEGIIDGTIDMIATDHAPHSLEEKSKGLVHSPMGVTGLETAFSVLYTELVKKNIISLEKLIQLMSINPAKRFNLISGISVGQKADIAVFDLNESYKINPASFASMGKSTPFAGKQVSSKCIMTICGGKIVFEDNIR